MGCGSFQRTVSFDSNGAWLSQTVGSICFNSEGNGRIESPFGKFVFSYESGLKKMAKVFQLSISIPIVGEEMLELDYGVPIQDQKFLRSSLYKSFLENASERGYSQKDTEVLLREFIVGLSRYLDLVTNLEKIKCEVRKNGECSLATNEGFILQGRDLKYWRQFATNHQMQIVHSGWDNGKFERFIITLLHSESKLFGLNLYRSQCFE